MTFQPQLPAAIDDWFHWSLHQEDLTDLQQVLCYGPRLTVQQFDRATFAEARFVASRAENAKFARDSLVLRHSNGQYHAGRVKAFLSHQSPGWEGCNSDEEANIAEVEWFAPAATL